MLPIIKGCTVIFVLCITSLIGEFVVGFVCFPLVFIAPVYFRHAFDIMTGSWQSFVIVVLELVGGVQFVSSGDEFRSGERSLIVMNHRTRLDWMFFWSVLSRQSTTRTLKITLKSALKYIPGPGWAMQCAAYIFLKRRWDEDEQVIKKMLKYYVDLNYPCQVLLFPEGTNLTANTKQSSDRFAEKSGLPKLQYVLHPRLTGFTSIIEFLMQHKHVDCIYDVTVAYPDSVPENGSDILFGRLPSVVHFHVKRHALPAHDQLGTWLTDRWTEKEAALTRFYTQPAPPSLTPYTGLTYRFYQAGLCMLWGSLVLVVLNLLVTLWVVRWCAAAWVCVHLVANRLGGIDELQADSYSRWWNTPRTHSN